MPLQFRYIRSDRVRIEQQQKKKGKEKTRKKRRRLTSCGVKASRQCSLAPKVWKAINLSLVAQKLAGI